MLHKYTKGIVQLLSIICFLTLTQTSIFARKNVLFLMADDFNYWTSKDGYYPQAKTPKIDELANMGVFFRQAHCPSPVCNPSRNAIWSGLRPSTTGIDANGDDFIREKAAFKDIITMNQYFKENGYWVYGAGKLYHPKMNKSNHETDPENWSYINENGHGCNGGTTYKYCNSAKSNYCFSANPNAMTRNNCGDYNLANDVKELIEAYPSSSQKDMPFFIACGLFRPHMPWNSPLIFWEKFDYNSLTKPAGYNASLDDPGNNIHQDFVDNDQWMRAIQAYLASCALADHNVGIMVDAVMASEYKDSTIIVFCGDHGWNLGEKGRWGKYDRCDEANHTTLIIYDPTASGNGQECVKPVSLQDLYPTLIELCDLPQRNNVEGNSLKPLLDTPDNPNIESFALMMYGDRHYIKTEKWRFIDDGNDSKLHNNIDDPYEWHNLYGQAQYNSVVEELRHKMDSVIAIGTAIKNNYHQDAPPSAPSNLSARPVSSTQIDLKWHDNSGNEKSFVVYRKESGETDYTERASLVANSASFSDTELDSTLLYSYYVTAVNEHGTSTSNIVENIQAQKITYLAEAYNNSPWAMPGTSVMAYQYDKVGEGNNWLADSAVSIGLYNSTMGTAGQDKRAYGDACNYTAARWNGGSNTMRDNGQWLRYTCTFEQGDYKLKLRGRNVSEQLSLIILDQASLSEIYSTSLNYPSDFNNLGAGGDNSGVTFWYEKNINIHLDAGTYVVELSVPSETQGGVLGEFTFVKNTANALLESNEELQSIIINNTVKDRHIRLNLTELNPTAWIRVIDLQGNIVQELMIAGEEVATIELKPSLPQGVYFIYVDDSEKQFSEQFLLL